MKMRRLGTVAIACGATALIVGVILVLTGCASVRQAPEVLAQDYDLLINAILHSITNAAPAVPPAPAVTNIPPESVATNAPPAPAPAPAAAADTCSKIWCSAPEYNNSEELRLMYGCQIRGLLNDLRYPPHTGTFITTIVLDGDHFKVTDVGGGKLHLWAECFTLNGVRLHFRGFRESPSATMPLIETNEVTVSKGTLRGYWESCNP